MFSFLEIEPLKTAFKPDDLWGRSAPFDLPGFKASLEAVFEMPLVSFECRWSKKPVKRVQERIPTDSRKLSLALSPFQGKIELYIPHFELDQLTNLLFKSKESHKETLGEEMKRSFTDYWLAIALVASVSCEPLSRFQLQNQGGSGSLTDGAKELIQGLFSLKFQEFSLSGAIVLSNEFHQEWLNYWQKNPYLGIDESKASDVQLALHLRLGELTLEPRELQQLEVGDWISLSSVGLKDTLVGNRADLFLGKEKVAAAKLGERAVSILKCDDFFDRLILK